MKCQFVNIFNTFLGKTHPIWDIKFPKNEIKSIVTGKMGPKVIPKRYPRRIGHPKKGTFAG
jgi:hypothetical protein